MSDTGWDPERGQASLLVLGVMFLLLVGAVVLFAFGSALGRGASVSAGRFWRRCRRGR